MPTHACDLSFRNRDRPTLGQGLGSLRVAGVCRRDNLDPFLPRRKGGLLDVLRHIRLRGARDRLPQGITRSGG